MDQHSEQMGKFLETVCSSKTSCVVPDRKYAEILNVIKHPFGYKDRLFRHKVKVKGYQIMDLPGLGVKDALVIPKKESSKGETSSGFLRVIPESKVYDVMQQVHCKELNHAGYKKCREYVSILFLFPFFNN